MVFYFLFLSLAVLIRKIKKHFAVHIDDGLIAETDNISCIN